MAKQIDRSALTFLLGLSSATLAGCDQSHEDANWKVCVDAQNRRVADASCQTSGGGHGGTAWAYYGGGRRVPAIGEPALGAAPAPAGGGDAAAAPPAGVARGGFGATGEGHGGGGPGGAGE
jgi:hypothetical protein